MNLIKTNKFILLISFVLIILSLLIGSTKLALLISGIFFIFTLLNREAGIFLLISIVSFRPFLIELNPGLKITGDFIILALLLSVIFLHRKHLATLFKFEPLELAFFAFLAVGTISALLTGVGLASIIIQIRAYVLFYIVYYVVKRLEFSPHFIKRGLLFTFLIGIVLSLQGIVEKISDKTLLMPEAWTQWTLSETNAIRVYGLLKGPNELALYLIISFILSLYLLHQYAGFKKVMIYVGLSIIGTTFLLTYSRGAFLAVLVFLILYVICFRNIKRLVPIILIGLTSVVFFFGINQAATMYEQSQSVNEDHHEAKSQSEHQQKKKKKKENDQGYKRYTQAFSKETVKESSSFGRVYFVKKAVEVFKDHPVIGTGFGTFGGAATLAHSSPIYKDYNIGFDFYSDNQYILTLTETGIIGVIILFVFVFGFFIKTIKSYKQLETPYAITTLFFFSTLLVGGTVYNILENDTFMLYYFLLFAIATKKLARTP